MFSSPMFGRTGASPMVVVLGGNNDCRLATPYSFWLNYVNPLQSDIPLHNLQDLIRIAYNFFSAEILESVTTFWPNTI